MLGLWPLPEKTPLKATVTGTLERGGVTIEKLHFQSKPGLYVTGNLYRPKANPTVREQAASCPRSSTSAATPAAAATATRPPSRTTACGSPRTATSAWSSTRCSSARSPASTTAPTLPTNRRDALLVAQPRLHARRRRVLERHPRHRLPADAAGRGPGADRRHRHLRRRGGDGLDRRRRRARQGGRARQRHERPGELRQEQGHQRPLRLHVLYNTYQWEWTTIAALIAPRPHAVRQLATTTASSRWTATAASSSGCASCYKMLRQARPRGRVRQRRAATTTGPTCASRSSSSSTST